MPINNESYRNDEVNFNVDFFQIFFKDDSGELMGLRPFQTTDDKARAFFASLKKKYRNAQIDKRKHFYVSENNHDRQEFLNSMLNVEEMADIAK